VVTGSLGLGNNEELSLLTLENRGVLLCRSFGGRLFSQLEEFRLNSTEKVGNVKLITFEVFGV
jgi:hypothetical protein